MRLYYYLRHRMCWDLLIVLFCNLLFVHLGGFYLMMMKLFQKWLNCLLVFVLRMCYRFLLVTRKEIQ